MFVYIKFRNINQFFKDYKQTDSSLSFSFDFDKDKVNFNHIIEIILKNIFKQNKWRNQQYMKILKTQIVI